MAQLTSKELSQRMSQRLANFKLSDDVITKLADRILIDGWSIGRFNPCIYGICIDYFSDKAPKLDAVLRGRDIATIEIFPYGIIDWDRFHIRVGMSVDGLEGRGVVRDLGR